MAIFNGGADDDTFIGTNDADQLNGGDGADILDGGYGDDTLQGGAGADYLMGETVLSLSKLPNSGDDVLDGGDGNDILFGGAGDDILMGGAGDDRILTPGGRPSPNNGYAVQVTVWDWGVDVIDGGAGHDWAYLDYTHSLAPIVFTLNGPDQVSTVMVDGVAGTTITGVEEVSIAGGSGNDRLTGGDGSDALRGGYGDDILIGGAGSDQLNGGWGVDTLIGGLGDDTYWISDGDDTIVEDADGGHDAILVTAVYKTVFSMADYVNIEGFWYQGPTASLQVTATDAGGWIHLAGGDDTLIGGAGNDSLDGEAGDDVLQGAGGDDELQGGLGADILAGGTGDDLYYFLDSLPTGDTIVENAGEGVDTLWFGVAGSFSIAALPNIENIKVGDVDFTATGNDAANLISGDNTISGSFHFIGGGGDDVLIGGSRDDLLEGGEGADRLSGGMGVDTLIGGAGDDTYEVYDTRAIIQEAPGGGRDTVISFVDGYHLAAGVEVLTLLGYAHLGVGNAGDNVLNGSVFNNTLIGGAGADVMIGGSGDDAYEVTDVGDVVIEGTDPGQDVVFSTLDRYVLPANVETLVLVGAAQLGAGNAQNNTLYGNALDNTLIGGAGNDAMVGGAGNDTYEVTETGDSVYENAGEGRDVVFSYADRFALGANVESLVLVGSAVMGVGNAQANTLYGNALDNTLIGGAGADAMVGGAGNDTYEVTDAGDAVYENAGEGVDVVFSYLARYDLGANVEVLALAGSAVMGVGNAQANTLIGNAQDNTLIGGAGNDAMYGGAGNDTYEVTEAGDAAYENAGEGQDVVFSYAQNFTLGANIETLILVGQAVAGVGNDQANSLTGNALNNVLSGGAGNDNLNGAAGDDRLTGGVGNDTFWFLTASAGKDVITDFTDGVDRIVLDHALFPDFATVRAHAAQVGDDVVITYDQNTSVTVEHFALANLTASDILFA